MNDQLADFLSFREYDRLLREMMVADLADEHEEYHSARADIIHLASLNEAVAEEARAAGFAC